MSLHDAVHLGQTETRAESALGGEERLEGALSDFRRHAGSGVANLEANLVVGDQRAKSERAPANHRVERVVDEIEQRFAQLTGDADDLRALTDFALEMDRAAAGALGPERTRHRDHFVADHREIDRFFAIALE